MKLPKGDLYVIIVGHDGVKPEDGPMVWEHYLKNQTSLAIVTAQARELAKRYGGARIAKLEILDIEL